jgi:tripartite-type tricarboxylate transporter receptor subunit TctC
MMAGVNLVHVPYRGGAPAITDLIGGQVQVIFSPVPESIEYIRAGKLRPLAAMSGTRLEVLPNLPTVGDFLPGYDASGWQGLVHPKTHLPKSLTSSTRQSVSVSLIRESMRGSLSWAASRLRARLPPSGGLSQMTPKSSPR